MVIKGVDLLIARAIIVNHKNGVASSTPFYMLSTVCPLPVS